MPLDPQVRAIRDQLERDNAPRLYTMSIAAARAADVGDAIDAAGSAEPVAGVRELVIPGPAGDLPARLYWPAGGGTAGAGAAADGAAGAGQAGGGADGAGRAGGGADGAGRAGGGARPVLVYFFGGGWSLGTLDTCDGICRVLANLAGCVTVSVGYRLAPEHKFPAAVEDCYAGLAWVAAHAAELGADPAAIAVGGDSSGGNLAAAVALLARDRGGPALAHQLLVYPNTDYQADTPSMREMTDPFLFNPTAIAWYWSMYLAAPGDGASPLASPLRADTAGLPPATVITAEYDPLRDEGERYAARLAEAGVPAEVVRYDGMMHGFFTMVGRLDTARQAAAHAAGRLRAAFSASDDLA